MSKREGTSRSSPVRELEFDVSGTSYPFVSLSNDIDCRTELLEMLPRGDGTYAEFFAITDADPERVLDRTDGHDRVTVTPLSEYPDGGLFEFQVADLCPAVVLAELGALPRVVRSTDGTGRIVADVPSQYEVAPIVDTFLSEFPTAELTAKRQKDTISSMFSRTAFRQELYAKLTDRQYEVLETAFETGYYDWPRECSGEEVATRLDITSATFSQHIHAAERKLLTVLFETPQRGARNRTDGNCRGS